MSNDKRQTVKKQFDLGKGDMELVDSVCNELGDFR